MHIIDSFRQQVQLHRIQYPAYSEREAQKLFYEMLKDSQAVAKKKFESPLYYNILEEYNRDARTANLGYPGGLTAFFQDVQQRWYRVGAAHADHVRSGSHPAKANAFTGEFRQNPKSTADTNRGKTPDRTRPQGGAKSAPDRPRSTTPGPQFPPPEATMEERRTYEKELYNFQKKKHAGKPNVDTIVKGTWSDMKFTQANELDGFPCRTCYIVKKKTVHHSTGRAGCPCSLSEKMLKYDTRTPKANSLSSRKPSPPPPTLAAVANASSSQTPTLEEIKTMFTGDQRKALAAVLASENTSITTSSGGATPTPPSVKHISEGGADSDDDGDEEFPAFQRAPQRMAWPITKAKASLNMLTVNKPSAVPPSAHNRKKVQQGYYMPLPTPPNDDDAFQPASPDYSVTSSEEANTDSFTVVNSKKAFKPSPTTTHSVNVLNVNSFDALTSDDSDVPEHAPLLSDGHSDEAHPKLVSAKKKMQRREQKKLRKARSLQDDESWYVPVRPLRPHMTTRSTQTFETHANKLPKADISPSGAMDLHGPENPNRNHEKTSHAATETILGTGEVVLSHIVQPQHVPTLRSPPQPHTPSSGSVDLHGPTTPSWTYEDATLLDDGIGEAQQLINLVTAEPPPPSTTTLDDIDEFENESRHEDPEDFTVPISQNPEYVSPNWPQTQGFSQLGPSDDLYESSSDGETAYEPPSSSPWPLTFDDDTIDQWLAIQLAKQAPRHIDMNETFDDNALFHQSLGYGGNTTH
ncbi:hypothetical protein CYMTET_5989 [Cymbomonas tetramitiformis]|uniref:Uncharacterized protein n=1 Tax=Cymbomonas tetramitiformis TaxID=36881 RepID=A0AAE0GXZ2_9CHLO|nr:hypothetical protein CYMTET_5989 [Cymbomonas tetramitiformis]